MTTSIRRSPGIQKAFEDVFPVPIKATRAPTSSDIKFPLGQVWVRTDTGQAWFLVTLASGTATWALASPGASDVDTLTGDSGGAISPSSGNITLAGGTNITSVGSGSTITFNLDAAVTLATSISSPLYTVAAGTDLDITAASGQDLVIKMGDAAGANKVSFTDSADVEVAAIDSNGGFSMGSITFTGLLTASASATIDTAGTALNLATDNSADAVNIGLGTSARDIHIGDSAAAHTITIGSTTGAASLDLQVGTGNFTIDGAAASTYTIGASTTTGTITIGGTSQTGDFVLGPSDGAMTTNLANANGTKTINIGSGINGNTISIGNGANTSAQIINVANGASAADSTINILSGNGSAGTQTLNVLGGTRAGALNLATGAAAHVITIGSASAGAIAVDTASGISLDGATASNFTVTGAGQDLTLASSGGRVDVSATEDTAQAIYLHANGGTSETIQIHADQGTGVSSVYLLSDVGGITLESGLASADAINLSATAGGIDIDGALQVNIASSQNATDAIRINASAGGIDIDAAGAAGEDITIDNAAGSIGISAGEAIADALVVNASAGGLQLLAGGGAALDTLITNTSGSMTLTAGESVSDAMNITASGAAGAINLSAGTGGITMDTGLTTNVVNKVAADSPYALLGTDFVVACDTSAGVITVTLPAAPATGRMVYVVDEGGSAGANNITVDGNGNNIAGSGTLAASDVIDSNYGTLLLIYNGTFWNGFDVA